jgi:hypothetical protein
VRADLSNGQQAAQICHALTQFSFEHPNIFKDWHLNSNYICLLYTEDERSLNMLLNKTNINKISNSYFLEPDLNNQLTAICLEPSPKTKKLTKNLNLAFNVKDNV